MTTPWETIEEVVDTTMTNTKTKSDMAISTEEPYAEFLIEAEIVSKLDPSNFTKEEWDIMSVSARAMKASSVGLSGQLGSKPWEELSPGEKTTLMHPDERPARQEYKLKAHLALEDSGNNSGSGSGSGSDSNTWGILKDTHNDYAWVAGLGEIVGTWTRSPKDGLIHVFLEESIIALVDKATQNFAKYAEARRAAMSAPKTTRARTTTARVKAPVEEPGPSENQIKIDNLRGLFGINRQTDKQTDKQSEG